MLFSWLARQDQSIKYNITRYSMIFSYNCERRGSWWSTGNLVTCTIYKWENNIIRHQGPYFCLDWRGQSFWSCGDCWGCWGDKWDWELPPASACIMVNMISYWSSTLGQISASPILGPFPPIWWWVPGPSAFKGWVKIGAWVTWYQKQTTYQKEIWQDDPEGALWLKW